MLRRSFLMTAAAMMVQPRIASASVQATLVAAPVTQQILPPDWGGATPLLGFNGHVPGPELRVGQGEPFKAELENGLNEGAAVHWHGVRLENAMDGVPKLTQQLVPPGDRFTYSFTPRDAGTYWYHSHYLSHEQVARGLMGALIVEEATPPDVDHDFCVVLTDWRLQEDGHFTDDFGNRHDVAHAGRMGNFARAFLPDTSVKTGGRVRLRIINAAVDRIFPLEIKGLEGRVVALDGMPLAAPRPFDDPMLAPAQRMDIIGDVTEPIELGLRHRDGIYALGTIATSGETPRRDTPIESLPPNALPVPGEVTQSLTLKMMGGAMGGGHGGEDIWAFNDVSGMQPEPFARFKRGETARIRLINDTRFPHGIHLHGHHFYEVSDTGELGDFRDTSLLMRGEARDILCVFDNPGKWMLHCHMLSHQHGGMKTWVEVV